MNLSTLDIVLVVLYLVGIALFGLWMGRGMQGGFDLFLAGKSLPWWAVGASLVVSDIGAKDMVGLADDGYRYGLVMTNFDLIGCVFPVLVAAFLFMPFLWLAGVYTIPEYLGRRYNQPVRVCFAVIWAFFMVGTLSVIFVSAGSMFASLLGWQFVTAVLVTAILVAVYTTFGGLKAVVYTDLVSCVVLIVGAILICVFGLYEVGGWSEMKSRIAAIENTEHHFRILRPANDPNYPWPAVLLGLGFVLGPAYWIGNQAIVQRTFGSSSQSAARASYVLCAAIKTIFPFLLVVPGMIGLALFHDKIGPADAPSWQGGRVLPELVKLLPTGVLGIVLGAFLAGIMSNLDSYVNSASTLCVSDIYKPFLRKQASDRECLWVGRGLVLLFLTGGAVFSFVIRNSYGSVFEAFQQFLSFFQGPLLSLLLLGMLFARITPWSGFAGLIVGVTTSVLMTQLGFLFLWCAWWSFVASVIAMVLVSMVTRPYNREQLRGLVCWLPPLETS